MRATRMMLGAAMLVASSTMPSGNATAQGRNSRALFNQWAAISATPLAGAPASIGFYSAGCLQGAQALPLDGPSYAVMRPSRHRYYGHPELLTYLSALATKTQSSSSDLLLIGDMGPARGGPMLSGHASHQNGLDADVWFITLGKRPTSAERERIGAPGFVVNRKTLKPTFGPAQSKLLVAAADNPLVDRIFVSPPIKRYMCEKFPSAPWLYRLRPWWGHEEHFHVRLTCPPDSPLCKTQDPLNPADNSCGSELDWWFSKDADREWAKILASTEPRQFPVLPAECSAKPR